MKAIERRQYEMLLRVRDFGKTHGELFAESSAAHQTFATLNRLIDDVTVADMMKMSAWVSAKADRKAAARDALVGLLVKTIRLAQVLRARGRDAPPFEFPSSRSDQALLTAGRQFARDAALLEADFTAHGMPPTLLADTTAAFEMATNDREKSRSDHIAARTRIHELLAAACVEARGLDVVVSNELAGDQVLQTVWKQARHVENPRRSRTQIPAEEPASILSIVRGPAAAAVPSAAAAA